LQKLQFQFGLQLEIIHQLVFLKVKFKHIKLHLANTFYTQNTRKKNNKKHRCCCDSWSYCIWHMVYWQIIQPVSATNGQMACMHNLIQRAEFMNAPELKPLQRDHW